jgi:DNA-binding NtrC family response regulator
MSYLPPPASTLIRAVRVLLVDDETLFVEALSKVLRRRGFVVGTASSAEEGIAMLAAADYEVVVLDLRMPGAGGLAGLREMSRVRPETRIIMLTGHGTVAAGIEAMLAGATDFLRKPVAVDDLVAVIQAAAESPNRA